MSAFFQCLSCWLNNCLILVIILQTFIKISFDIFGAWLIGGQSQTQSSSSNVITTIWNHNSSFSYVNFLSSNVRIYKRVKKPSHTWNSYHFKLVRKQTSCLIIIFIKIIYFKQSNYLNSFYDIVVNTQYFLGMRFGLMQSKIALACILRNFRVKLNPVTKTPLEVDPVSFITTIKGGVWLDFEKLQ